LLLSFQLSTSQYHTLSDAVAFRYFIDACTKYADAMAISIVLDPGQYQVIVTNNMFGDILTNLGAALQGKLEVAASANLHPGRVSLFEPAHGSAPDKAGRGIANPIGAVATTAMMLDYLGYSDVARRIEQAIEAVCEASEVTIDLGENSQRPRLAQPSVIG
jgi:3-isopropylmalate dehydrogenase